MDNNDYRAQLEEAMRNKDVDDDFMKKLLEAQEIIMHKAEKLITEMKGVGDSLDLEKVPDSEKSRAFMELNEKLSDMITLGMSEISAVAAEIEERRSTLEGVEVPEDLMENMKKYRRNSIYIEKTEAEITAGCSKIGGNPDLCEGFEWMRNPEGKALAFLMQINCGEIHPFDKDNEFPEKGMMYFFYDLEASPWNSEENRYAVCYYGGDVSELKPCEFPDKEVVSNYCFADVNCTIDESAVKFFCSDDLPEYDDASDIAEDYSYEEYEGARFRILGYDPYEYSEKYYKLGGYSNSIQYGLSEEFDSSYVQLCQLTTYESEKCGFMFGDGGNLYFYIKKEDLINKRFDRTEIVLQCY